MATTYLAPGVYVEEVAGGSKPIEGVATSVAGFIGFAEKGPFNTPAFDAPTGRSSAKPSATSSRAPTSPTASMATSTTAAASATWCAWARDGNGQLPRRSRRSG